MLLIAAQIVGIVAVALYLLSLQLKERRHIIFTTCISNCLYVLQYLLLGAFSGAILDLLSTASSFFAGKKNDPNFRRYAKVVAVIVEAVIVTAGLAVAIIRREWTELIAVMGAFLHTTGLWFNNEQTIRKFALAGSPFWLTYNFLSRAYGAALGSVFATISAIIALWRYSKSKSEIK